MFKLTVCYNRKESSILETLNPSFAWDSLSNLISSAFSVKINSVIELAREWNEALF